MNLVKLFKRFFSCDNSSSRAERLGTKPGVWGGWPNKDVLGPGCTPSSDKSCIELLHLVKDIKLEYIMDKKYVCVTNVSS